jgi:hypothetical protein
MSQEFKTLFAVFTRYLEAAHRPLKPGEREALEAEFLAQDGDDIEGGCFDLVADEVAARFRREPR